MSVKWKAIIILVIILIALVPVYAGNKFLQKSIRPRESLLRLFAYLVCGMLLVFIFTTLLVFVIKLIFPGE